MKEKTIKIKDVTADEYTKTLKKSMSEMKDGDALFVQYSGRGNSTRVEKISIPLKEKQPLLRRFRWPLFIALFASAQTAGLAYLYGDTHTAMIAFVVALGVMFLTICAHIVDKQRTKKANEVWRACPKCGLQSSGELISGDFYCWHCGHLHNSIDESPKTIEDKYKD